MHFFAVFKLFYYFNHLFISTLCIVFLGIRCDFNKGLLNQIIQKV